jgi:hypothetical protein
MALYQATGFFSEKGLKAFVNAAAVVLSVMVLISPAIVNRYPFLFFDSGTYILHGFTNKLMLSHPMMYAWFVRHMSMAYSLWFTVIAQALIVWFMIWATIKASGLRGNSFLIGLTVIIVLRWTTGLAYYPSQIMPDFFLSMVLLAIYLLVARTKLPLWNKIIMAVIIFTGNTAHLSNLPVSTGAFVATVLFMLLFARSSLHKNTSRSGMITVGILLLAAWFMVPAYNAMHGKGFRMSMSGNTVRVSKLLTTGALQNYLHKTCGENPDFHFCKYEGEIDRYTRMDYFLWDLESFLYDHPCKEKNWMDCWTEREEEFAMLINRVLADTESRNMYLRGAIHTALEQLVKFDVLKFDSFDVISSPDYPIREFMKDDIRWYEMSAQQEERQAFDLINTIQVIVVPLSLLFLIVSWMLSPLKQAFNTRLRMLLLISIAALLVNAMLVGMLGDAVGRFQGRIIWLIPFIACLVLIQFFLKEPRKASGSE